MLLMLNSTVVPMGSILKLPYETPVETQGIINQLQVGGGKVPAPNEVCPDLANRSPKGSIFNY